MPAVASTAGSPPRGRARASRAGPTRSSRPLHVFAVVDGRYLAEARADRLGRVSCGTSCIRFALLDRVDVVELDRPVRDAVRAQRDGTNAAGAG